jgi:hypothetical protein
MSLHLDPTLVEPFVAGLVGGIDVETGPTDEQLRVLGAIVSHVWNRPDIDLGSVATLEPDRMVHEEMDPHQRRLFCELLICLELCRHPQSEAQVARVESYAAALDINEQVLGAVRMSIEVGAAEATEDLERFYGEVLPELSEPRLRDQYLRLEEPDHALAERLRVLSDLPPGTLGREYLEFYRRYDLVLPGDDPHFPAHYVGHDMNHVITGYLPTAPGEIARSGFLFGASQSPSVWLQFLMTLAVHESGTVTHGDIKAKVGTLDRPGAADLLGEGLARGSQCTVDLTKVDHLAIAHLPVDEVRQMFNVVPLVGAAG